MFHVCMCVKYNSILYMYNMHILTIADILKYKRKKVKKRPKMLLLRSGKMSWKIKK